MRGGHGRARDGVGGGVAADPGREDVDARRGDVDDGAVVGEVRKRPARVDGRHRERVGGRRRRRVGRVHAVVAGCDHGENAR